MTRAPPRAPLRSTNNKRVSQHISSLPRRDAPADALAPMFTSTSPRVTHFPVTSKKISVSWKEKKVGARSREGAATRARLDVVAVRQHLVAGQDVLVDEHRGEGAAAAAKEAPGERASGGGGGGMTPRPPAGCAERGGGRGSRRDALRAAGEEHKPVPPRAARQGALRPAGGQRAAQLPPASRTTRSGERKLRGSGCVRTACARNGLTLHRAVTAKRQTVEASSGAFSRALSLIHATPSSSSPPSPCHSELTLLIRCCT